MATTEQQSAQQSEHQHDEGQSPEAQATEQSQEPQSTEQQSRTPRPMEQPWTERRSDDRTTGGRTRRRDRVGRMVDAPEDRPGVPKESEPRPAPGAHWKRPSPQPGRERHLHRAGIDEPTPVVGTAQPPRGVSGLIRKKAYEVPERFAKHWALLFVADRVDVLEDRLGPVLAKPLDGLGFPEGSRYVRSNPIGVLAGVVAGAWLTKRVLFG